MEPNMEGLLERIEVQVMREIERTRNAMKKDARRFHVVTGARLTLAALLRADAFKEEIKVEVQRWADDGGQANLVLDGETIIGPPETVQ